MSDKKDETKKEQPANPVELVEEELKQVQGGAADILLNQGLRGVEWKFNLPTVKLSGPTSN